MTKVMPDDVAEALGAGGEKEVNQEPPQRLELVSGPSAVD